MNEIETNNFFLLESYQGLQHSNKIRTKFCLQLLKYFLTFIIYNRVNWGKSKRKKKKKNGSAILFLLRLFNSKKIFKKVWHRIEENFHKTQTTYTEK